MLQVDNFLNKITMYRLVLYGLFFLFLISVGFGFSGHISFSPISQITSLVVILFSCFLTNYIISKVLRAETNVESVWISSFILFFVISPAPTIFKIQYLVVSSVLAMVSKYIFAISKSHIFNPVAISVFILGLFGAGYVSWWVGNSILFLPTIILGLLILRKIKRFEMFFIFFTVAIVVSVIFGLIKGFNVTETLISNIFSGPILFFGFIMLTEPATSPPRKLSRIIYSGIAGLFFGSQFEIGRIFSTPELALVLANIYSFVFHPRTRLPHT
jgi:glycine betaine catabolism B